MDVCVRRKNMYKDAMASDGKLKAMIRMERTDK